MSLLRRGDQVPHFEARTVDCDLFRYSSIWQRKNLLLVLLPAGASAEEYLSALRAKQREFQNLDTECVISRDRPDGLRAPGVLVADRWGEVIHIVDAPEAGPFPRPDDLLGWFDYIQNRCPECEGEAR